MDFETKLSHEDLIAFNEDYVTMTFGRTITRNRWLSSLSCGAMAGLILGLWIARDNVVSGVIVGLLVGVVTFVALPSIQKDRFKKLVRQAYETTDDKTMVGVHRHVVREDGIQTTTEHSESFYKWSAVQHARLAAGRLYVYVGPNKALIIPSRTLQGATIENIVTSIKQHAPSVTVVEA